MRNFTPKFKSLALVAAFVLTGLTASAQLTGTKNVPGDYPDLNSAIIDLNTVGVGAGGVTINVVAGNPQVAPAGGYVITATGTAANNITFTGNNNVVMANAALTVGSINDAIFKIMGGDFINITQFVMQENPANTINGSAATNNMTEFGVALFYASATDGAQNNSIIGNAISLSRTYANTFGVYSNTRHTAAAVTTTADVTAASGSNSNNKVYANVISNVNIGIAFVGSGTAANMDNGNDIGGTSTLTANTISNWGGAAPLSSYVSVSVTSYCIYMNHQNGENVSYNTITSAAVSGTSVSFRGILKDYTTANPTGTFTSSYTNNTITLNDGFLSGTVEGIRSQGISAATGGVTININNNTFLNNAITGAATSSALLCIGNSSIVGTLNINGNIIRGTTSTATTGGFTGITNTAAVVNAINISNNQLGNASGGVVTFSAATSGTFTGISNTSAAATCTVTINANDFRGIVYNTTSASTNTYIQSTGAALNNNITNNTLTNLSINTSNSATFISHSYTMPANGICTINGNSIVTAYNKTGGAGTFTFATTGASSPNGTTGNYTNNNISNITVNGSSGITGITSSDGTAAGTSTKVVTGNIFNNWNAVTGSITGITINYLSGAPNISNNTLSNFTTGAAITGINIGSSLNTATAVTISSNTISSLVANGAGGTVIAFGSSNTSPGFSFTGNTINTLSSAGTANVVAVNFTQGNTVTISKNKIYDLLSTGGNSSGISISAGTTFNVVNNLIGDLRVTSTSAANPVNGLTFTAATTVNAYYNTIYLNATSAGANFGSSGISATTTINLDLRNNLVVNLSTPNGTGFTVAYRRSSTTLTTYQNTSNNNSFYAGAPSASRLIFYDGTNSDQTLGAFQTRVSPRDGASLSQNPAFASLSGASPVFLHIPAATATLLESGGTVIPAFTTDYDNDSRPGPAGSVNGGALAPDIGADEFDGALLLCSGAVGGTISPATANACAGSTTVISTVGSSTGPGITYQWQVGTTSGGPYSNVTGGSGATTTSYTTGALTAGTYYYVLQVTCSAGPVTSPSNEFTLTVNPSPTVTVTPTTATYCNPGPAIALTASGATTYAWGPAAGLSATTGATVNASPGAVTTYTVTGTTAGCTGTATTTISVGATPTVTVTATPPSVCSGGSSQLLATGVIPATSYSVTAIPYAPTTGSGPQATTGDDAVSGAITLPFTFNFYGTAYTQAFVYTNGFIQLGASSGSTGTYGKDLTSAAAPNTVIGGVWSDLNSTAANQITTYVTGTAPNRIFTVYYNNVGFYDFNFTPAVSGTVNFQILLYETSNIIEVHVGNSSGVSTTTSNKTLGIENSTGLLRAFPAGHNLANWSVAPATPEAWRFTPNTGTYTYGWTPGTFLSSTTIANPMATGITATTTYTATLTESSGCSSTGTVTITSGAALSSSANITPGNTVCEGTNITLNAVPTGGGAPYTYAWSGPGGFTSTLQNPVINGVLPAQAGTYSVTITDACTATSTSNVTLIVNPAPAVAVTPTSATYCIPGSAIALTASGATTYSWGPAAGLSATTGASVNATPAATTTYTVTGTAAGCTATATTVITVGNTPGMVSVTATPSSVCSGGNSQLLAVATVPGPVNTYTFNASTGGTLNPMAGATTVISTGDDDTPTAAPANIGFNFNFNGVNYTQYSVSPDGWILLGGATASAEYINAVTSTTNIPRIYPFWDDHATGTTGSVQTLVTGTAPNRIFIVQWFVTVPRNTVGAANSTFQAWLYESTNIIQFRYGTMGVPSSGSISGGLTGGATNFHSLTFTSNTSSTATANDVNTTAPASGTIYTYTPPLATSVFSWTPATFLNSTAIANPMASGITASTTYTVSVTTGGCSSTGTVSITAGSVLSSSANITPGNTVCAGTNITLNAVPTGGGAPYTYAWTGPGGFTSTLQNPVINGVTTAQAGTYSVTITDACTATSTANTTLTVNPAPSVAVSPASATYCTPGAAVALTASGATTYVWGPAAGLSATTGTSVNATPVATTTYTVTGTDAVGCTATATTTITSSETPSLVSVTATPATICSGSNSQLLAAAGTTSSYTVTNIPFVPVPTPGTGVTTLCNAGVQTTPMTNSSLDDGDWENQSLPFPVNFFGVTYNAFTVSTNGFIYLGSGAPQTYTGYGNTFPTTFSAHPCIGALYADLDFRTLGTINYFVSGTAPNRKFVLNYSGGQFYNGSGALTTQMIIYETSNVIEVHTTNSTSHSGVEGIQNAAGTVAYTVTGRNNQTFAVTTSDAYRFAPNGGPITYSWTPSTFLSSTTISNPMANSATASTTYTVSATSNGCPVSGTVTLTVNPLPTVSATASPATICAGASSTLTATGATTYTWMPGSLSGSSVTVTPAVTTTYTVTGTNASGCTNTATVTVTVNPLPTVSASAAPPAICIGSSSTLTGSGASTYAWMPGSLSGSSVIVTPASTTTYTVTGTDVNGCTNTATASVTVNPLPVVTLSGNNSFCAGGSSTLTGTSGGTSQWYQNGVAIPGATTNTYNATAAGVYNMIKTNASGCSDSAATGITITVNPLPVVSATAAPVSICAGSPTTLTASGATTYTWMPGSLSGSPVTDTPASTTTYTVTGTDINGCSNTATVNVTVNPAPVVTVTASPAAICPGSSTTMTASGADTYTWMPGSFTGTSVTDSPTTTTTYTVTGTITASGCTSTQTVTVTVNPLPVVALGNDTMMCGGTITLDAQNTGSTFLWSDASTSQMLTVSATGTYSVTVTDVNGCSASDAIDVTIHTVPVVALGADITQCGGVVTLDAGNPGSSYLWSDASMSRFLSVTASGTYYVTVTDSTGSCSASDTIAVTINPTPVVDLGPDVAQCTGTVLLDAGNPGETYMWSNSVTTSQTFTASATGIYWADVTNSFGCTTRDSVNVIINSNPTVTLGNDTTMCGGSITLNAGNPGATYLWNDNSTNQTLVATTSGTYYVTATLTGGCTASDTIVVTINAVPVVNLGNDTAQCGGTVTLNAQNAGATYLWNDSSTGQTLTASTTGFYYVDVTNPAGCSASDSVMVTINSLPSVTFTVADTVCDNGGFITLTGSPAGGTFFGVGVSGNTFDPTVPGPGATTLSYSYTDINGCSASANQPVFVDDCSGINEPVNSTSLVVYPNPNNGQFTIVISQGNGEGVLEITDALGQLISSESIAPVNGVITKEINLGIYSSGIYFVRFTTNATTTVEKVNVQR